MAFQNPPDAEIARILRQTRRIAVVGASAKPDRPSHGVMAALQRMGWQVVPVNPGLAGGEILGETVAASLAEAGPLDLVDVFRAPDAAGEAVDEAVRLGARAVWLQLGVVNEEAAGRAQAAGLDVVMDRCTKVEAARLGVRPG